VKRVLDPPLETPAVGSATFRPKAFPSRTPPTPLALPVTRLRIMTNNWRLGLALLAP